MKCNALVLIIMSFACAAILNYTPYTYATEDAIIAVVNHELITLRDLREYVRSTYVNLAASGMPEDKLQEVMLDLEINGINKLIDDKIILSHANQIGLSINEKTINTRLEEVKSKYPSEQAFTDALIKYGTSLSDIRTKIVEQLKIKYVVDHEVRSRIFVNPQEITDYYMEHTENYRIPEQVELDSIFIGFAGNTPEAAREKANNALARIKKGEGFRSVAEQYSDAPPIGKVARDKLLPAIVNAISGLAKNDPSSLVEVDTGIYIFQFKGASPSEIAPLEEVSDQIKNLIFQRKFRERFDKWLVKLKKNAYIDIKK